MSYDLEAMSSGAILGSGRVLFWVLRYPRRGAILGSAISFLLVWAPISFAAGLGLTINEITPMDQGDEKDSAHCWLGFSTFQTEQNNVCLAVVIHSNKHKKTLTIVVGSFKG